MVAFYEKRGNAEYCIKEAKYDMAVDHLLLKSYWANEAIFQLMMMADNLFLMFKMGHLKRAEYREQIRTFRWKYVFLAGQIIRTARRVIMEIPNRYPTSGCTRTFWSKVFFSTNLLLYPGRRISYRERPINVYF